MVEIKTPIHRFKNYVRYADNSKPAHWYPSGRTCWLGSGIADKNGHEIFEGDIVRFGEHDLQGTIVFRDAMFQIVYGTDNSKALFSILGWCNDFVDVQVVGHIAEAES